MCDYTYSVCADIDECSTGTDNCDPNTTVCRNEPSNFTCDCMTGYEPIVGNDTSCQGEVIAHQVE